TGRTREAVDRYAFLTAPELLPLRNIAGVSPAQSEQEQTSKISRFFDSGSKVYEPTSFGGVLFWKTEDIPESTPSWPPDKKDDVRKEVVRAWQRQEARKVARREAERIRAKVEGKSAADALKEFRNILKEHPSWGSLVRLDEVARQVAKPDTREGSSKR